jgi:hypothetical protein
MTYHCIRLSDDTEVCLDDATGYLHFTGKDFYKYHHVAKDVRDIHMLLNDHEEEIHVAAEIETTGRKPKYARSLKEQLDAALSPDVIVIEGQVNGGK